MPHTDAAAVALARDGDSEAFRALVERHSRAVFRLAHRMTGNPSDAEDVVQETFLESLQAAGPVRVARELRDLAAPDRGQLLDRSDSVAAAPGVGARHDRPGTVRAGRGGGRGPASPERLMLSAEVQERITAAMDSLSQMERAAFVLRHFEGHSIDEISRRSG